MGNPNRKQSILAQKSQQVIFAMIFYQNSNAVCSKVNKVRRQFLTSIRVEYEMSRTLITIYALTDLRTLIETVDGFFTDSQVTFNQIFSYNFNLPFNCAATCCTKKPRQNKQNG